MKELVEYIVKGLVEKPDEVSVVEVGGPTILLELTVAAEDMGRVIGKRGRIINAIRTLLNVAAAKRGKRVALELVEFD